nr:DUF2785 domain-containing protein [Alkaliphilus serpentinus]
MEYIGTTDSVLRDDLILSVLCYFIDDHLLSGNELKKLLDICLNDQHLFYRLGEEEDDSVFNRSFTILIVKGIVCYHNSNGENLLNEEEAKKIFNEVIRYVRLEKDMRGYVKEKGWAHSMGHAGDALRTLALCNHIKEKELLEILEVIKEKVGISYYVFINEETERLTSAAVNVIERNALIEEEVIHWIKSFEEIDKPADFPEGHYFRENTKGFLRSLYFRLKYRKASNTIIEELEKTIYSMNKFHS